VKTLVRTKLGLIPQKGHNIARDYIQYNKYVLYIQLVTETINQSFPLEDRSRTISGK